MWGTFPIALRTVVEVVDPVTVTWCRYLVSAVGMGVLLTFQGHLPTRENFANRRWLFFLIALIGFAANNFGFLLGLRLTTPSTAQIVIQLAPLLVIFGAVRWFGEHFRAWQWVGVGIIPLGLLVFFHQKLNGFSDSFGLGLLVLIGSAFLWAGYALAQKRLIRDMKSVAIMGIIYAAGTVLMLPAIHLSHLAALASTRW